MFSGIYPYGRVLTAGSNQAIVEVALTQIGNEADGLTGVGTVWTTESIGIVEKCENDTVYTVEGNSSDAYNQRRYVVGSSSIYGYGVQAIKIPDSVWKIKGAD